MQSPNESPLNEESGVEAPCDFAIIVEGETIPVRRNVLKANSWYFRAMLASGMAEVQNGCCIVRNTRVETVKACLEYITTNGEVLPLSKGTVTDVIGLSNLWQLDNAVQKCQEYMKEILNLPSWISTMRTAAFYELRDLEEWCITYIIRCLDECGRWEGVLQMSEYEVTSILAKASSAEEPCKLWVLCKKWWEHNGGTPGTTACTIIRRFPSTLFRNSGFQKVAFQDDHVITCENCGKYVLNTATAYLNPANCWIQRKCSVDTAHHSLTRRISEFMLRNHERVFAEKDLVEVEVDEFLSYVETLGVHSVEGNIRTSRRRYPYPSWNRHHLWPELGCGPACLSADDVKYLIVLAKKSYYENMGKQLKPDDFDTFSMRQLMYNLAILNGDHTVWKTTMRWIQADYEDRRNEFLRSFVEFPLYKFSSRFIEENMSSSTLLKESQECMDKLKSEVINRKHEHDGTQLISRTEQCEVPFGMLYT